MSSEAAIVLEHMTKRYRIGIGRARVREMIPPPFDRAVARAFPDWWTKDTFNALDDLTLTIPKGAALGVVGHNGAGKTTLLKVIASVTEPTTGSVRVRGRVAALIDVVVGFHPELTGVENAYMLGAMHGVSKREMDGYIERIIEFAEIPEMADTPMKRFSAGMITRIVFSTLACLEADVMLLDEVLAVGDSSFQQKCITWLGEFRKRGGTLVFVSHNIALMRSMTERVLWIDHGKAMAEGPTAQILAEYGRAMEHREDQAAKGQIKRLLAQRGQSRWGSGGATLEAVHLGQPAQGRSEVEVRIEYQRSDLDRALFRVGFIDEGGHEIGGSISPELDLSGDAGEVRWMIDAMPLRTGIYFPVVSILSPDGRVRDHWKLDRPLVVEREDGHADGLGPVLLEGSWLAGGNGDGSNGDGHG